jgi:hypothetical protein
MIFTAIQLDKRGAEYICDELASANPLGRAVRTTVAQNDGTTVAVIPEPHRADVYNFRHGIFPQVPKVASRGGAYLTRVPSTEDEVGAWVHTVVRSHATACFVCESYLLRSRDLARASRLPSRTLACGEFVYHFATAHDPPEAVTHVVGMAYPRPLGFAVLSLLAAPMSPEEPRAMTSDALDAIAAGVQSVFVGAYDGESVVIWTKRGALVQVVPATASGLAP